MQFFTSAPFQQVGKGLTGVSDYSYTALAEGPFVKLEDEGPKAGGGAEIPERGPAQTSRSRTAYWINSAVVWSRNFLSRRMR
jgi:hypothetical protein